MIGFALSLAVTVFAIYDVEFPRSGLIRIDSFDQVLVNALGSALNSRGRRADRSRRGSANDITVPWRANGSYRLRRKCPELWGVPWLHAGVPSVQGGVGEADTPAVCGAYGSQQSRWRLGGSRGRSGRSTASETLQMLRSSKL